MDGTVRELIRAFPEQHAQVLELQETVGEKDAEIARLRSRVEAAEASGRGKVGDVVLEQFLAERRREEAERERREAVARGVAAIRHEAQRSRNEGRSGQADAIEAGLAEIEQAMSDRTDRDNP